MSKFFPPPVAPTVAASIQQTALFHPVDAFVSRCGKRIRHALVQLSYQIAGGADVAPACLSRSIEMLHAGSLVVDDIQDGSELRREKPTLHQQIGLPLAINAGNWMYFDALSQLSDAELSPRMRLRLVSKMITASKRCHEGQACDLAARIDTVAPSDFLEVAMCISRQKTGCLVSLATQFGGIAAGVDRPVLSALSRFGMEIGVALQMRNDLDELLSLIRSAGKSLRSDDLRNARVTWPWAWAAKIADAQTVQQLIDRTRWANGDTAVLADVATSLLNEVYRFGNRLIQRRIARELDRLQNATHETTAFDALSNALSSISSPASNNFEANPCSLLNLVPQPLPTNPVQLASND